MKKTQTVLLLAAALLILLGAAACADGWPTYSDFKASIWAQTQDAYVEDAGIVVDPTSLSDGEYLAPRVYLTNGTGEDQTFSMYWVLDKSRKINFNTVTVVAGKTKSSTLSGDSAKNYYAEGNHTLEVYVNDVCVYGFTWCVTSLKAQGAGTDSENPSASGTTADGPTAAKKRSKKLTFSEYGATYKDVVVTGLIWRYRTTTNPNYAHIGNRKATAAHVKKILSIGGQYGLNYKVTFTKLEGLRYFNSKIIIRSPDGYEKAYKEKIYVKGTGKYWSYTFMGTEFFPAYLQKFGDIKSGTYTFYLYLDGMLANVSTLELY